MTTTEHEDKIDYDDATPLAGGKTYGQVMWEIDHPEPGTVHRIPTNQTQAAMAVLSAHATAGKMRREGQALEVAAVRDARRAGMSWRDIGAMLGVSASAAHQRFATEVAA